MTLLHATRTPHADARLGLLLAFVAGAINAGGFLTVGHYTSHMSGLVASLSTSLAMQNFAPVLLILSALIAFVAGAATCGWLVGWAQRNHAHGQYAWPMALEGTLILAFGLIATATHAPTALAFIVLLLCFIMGLQNATITRASGARIRTTHVTGIMTDMGIELGRMLHADADKPKLFLLTGLLANFFAGGVIGVFGFSLFGPAFTIPIGVTLLALAVPTLLKNPTT